MPPGNKGPQKLDKLNIGSAMMADMVAAGYEVASGSIRDLNIVEFAEQVLCVKLWPTQRAIMKALYNLPFERGYWRDVLKTDTIYAKDGKTVKYANGTLEEFGFEWDEMWDEREILERWKELGMTTWEEGRDYSELCLEAGMRSSKCVRGGTLVFVEDKGLVRIDSLVSAPKSGELVQSIDKSILTRFGFKRASHVLARSAERVINIRTRAGYELGGSVVHPLLVMNREGELVWKKMPDLTTDDVVCVKRGQGNFGTLNMPAEARFMGYLVGDGSFAAPNTIGFTNMDEEVINDFLQLSRDLLGYEPKVAPSHGKEYLKQINIYGKENRAKIETWGGKPGLSDTKEVPGFVLQGDQETVKNFLRALFDTDGCAALGSGGKTNVVTYTTVSEKLAFQVQQLLLQFGIICTRKKRVLTYIKKNGEASVAYHLTMHGDEARRFYTDIGFGLSRKQARFNPDVPSATTVNSIPRLSKMLIEMKAKEGYSPRGSGRRVLWEQVRRQCTDTLRKNDRTEPSGITYAILPKVIAYFEGVPGVEKEVAYLKQLQAQELYFDKITDIWETNEPVYDLCVPEVSEFLTNGIVSHNTSMTSIPCCYEFWKMYQYEDPAAEFGLQSKSLIIMLVMATGEDQAKDTLFAAIKGRLQGSPYFQGKIGKDISINELSVEVPSKFIKIWAAHSRTAGVVGRTQMVFGMDEANRFGLASEGGGQSGMETYANVGKGTMTLSRFGSKRFIISSAWARDDVTDTLYRLAESGEADHILAFRLPTWEMNPEFMKLGEDHPEIQKAYKTRKVEAHRDYGGVRPGVAEDFFVREVVYDAAKYEPAVGYRFKETEVVSNPSSSASSTGGAKKDSRKYSGIQVHFNAPQHVTLVPPRFWSYGHCDPGLKKDSFGFVSANPMIDEDGRFVISVNAVLEWEPQDYGRGNVLLVDYENVVTQILEIKDRLRLKYLSFDHWNSASLIQRLYSKGIATSEFKSCFSQPVQREIYQTTREWLEAGRIRLPHKDNNQACEKLLMELEKIKLMNGKKIDHPKKGSKDLADCLCAVVHQIKENERRFVPSIGVDGFVRSPNLSSSTRQVRSLFASPQQGPRVTIDGTPLLGANEAHPGFRVSRKDW